MKLFVPLVALYLCFSIILNAQDIPSYPTLQDNLAPHNAQSFANYKVKPGPMVNMVQNVTIHI